MKRQTSLTTKNPSILPWWLFCPSGTTILDACINKTSPSIIPPPKSPILNPVAAYLNHLILIIEILAKILKHIIRTSKEIKSPWLMPSTNVPIIIISTEKMNWSIEKHIIQPFWQPVNWGIDSSVEQQLPLTTISLEEGISGAVETGSRLLDTVTGAVFTWGEVFFIFVLRFTFTWAPYPGYIPHLFEKSRQGD